MDIGDRRRGGVRRAPSSASRTFIDELVGIASAGLLNTDAGSVSMLARAAVPTCRDPGIRPSEAIKPAVADEDRRQLHLATARQQRDRAAEIGPVPHLRARPNNAPDLCRAASLAEITPQAARFATLMMGVRRRDVAWKVAWLRLSEGVIRFVAAGRIAGRDGKRVTVATASRHRSSGCLDNVPARRSSVLTLFARDSRGLQLVAMAKQNSRSSAALTCPHPALRRQAASAPSRSPASYRSTPRLNAASGSHLCARRTRTPPPLQPCRPVDGEASRPG